MAYILKLDNAAFEMMFFGLPVIVYFMEMKYILCNELVLTVGEVGSVEIECFFAISFIYSGVYGVDWF